MQQRRSGLPRQCLHLPFLPGSLLFFWPHDPFDFTPGIEFIVAGPGGAEPGLGLRTAMMPRLPLMSQALPTTAASLIAAPCERQGGVSAPYETSPPSRAGLVRGTSLKGRGRRSSITDGMTSFPPSPDGTPCASPFTNSEHHSARGFTPVTANPIHARPWAGTRAAQGLDSGTWEEAAAKALSQHAPVVTQLLPWLYLSSAAPARVAEVIETRRVLIVINCAGEVCHNEFEASGTKKGTPTACPAHLVSYLTFCLRDGPFEDIGSLFYPAVDAIETARKAGGSALLHCHQGISRSASVAMAYLMWAGGWGWKMAYNHTRSLRPIVSPNAGFTCQLMEWETHLRTLRGLVRMDEGGGAEAVPFKPMLFRLKRFIEGTTSSGPLLSATPSFAASLVCARTAADRSLIPPARAVVEAWSSDVCVAITGARLTAHASATNGPPYTLTLECYSWKGAEAIRTAAGAGGVQGALDKELGQAVRDALHLMAHATGEQVAVQPIFLEATKSSSNVLGDSAHATGTAPPRVVDVRFDLVDVGTVPSKERGACSDIFPSLARLYAALEVCAKPDEREDHALTMACMESPSTALAYDAGVRVLGRHTEEGEEKGSRGTLHAHRRQPGLSKIGGTSGNESMQGQGQGQADAPGKFIAMMSSRSNASSSSSCMSLQHSMQHIPSEHELILARVRNIDLDEAGQAHSHP